MFNNDLFSSVEEITSTSEGVTPPPLSLDELEGILKRFQRTPEEEREYQSTIMLLEGLRYGEIKSSNYLPQGTVYVLDIEQLKESNVDLVRNELAEQAMSTFATMPYVVMCSPDDVAGLLELKESVCECLDVSHFEMLWEDVLI